MPQSQTRPVSASSCPDGGVTVDAYPAGASVGYQVCQWSFASTSGSGHTTWYFGKSDTNIPSPPIVPQAMMGHLYVHLNSSANTYQYWMLGGNNQWESVSKGSEYPLNVCASVGKTHRRGCNSPTTCLVRTIIDVSDHAFIN